MLYNLSKIVNLKNIRGKRNNILMYHFGRSGSTVLGNLIDQHIRVRWKGEVISYYLDKVGKNETINYLHALRWIYMDRARTLKKFYGIEIKPAHLDKLNIGENQFLTELINNGFNKFILLKRENILKKIVSSFLATETGLWHTGKTIKEKPKKIHLETENIKMDGKNWHLVDLLNYYTTKYQAIHQSLKNENLIELVYEKDILPDPLKGYNKVCDFLEIEPLYPKINFERTTPWKISSIISNYDEISKILINTNYSWMVRD